MFGLIGDLVDVTADVVGTVAGIAIAPVAIALGVSERMVRRAVQASFNLKVQGSLKNIDKNVCCIV